MAVVVAVLAMVADMVAMVVVVPRGKAAVRVEVVVLFWRGVERTK